MIFHSLKSGIFFAILQMQICKFAICKYMDELEGHYAGCNRLDTDRQILHDLT